MNKKEVRSAYREYLDAPMGALGYKFVKALDAYEWGDAAVRRRYHLRFAGSPGQTRVELTASVRLQEIEEPYLLAAEIPRSAHRASSTLAPAVAELVGRKRRKVDVVVASLADAISGAALSLGLFEQHVLDFLQRGSSVAVVHDYLNSTPSAPVIYASSPARECKGLIAARLVAPSDYEGLLRLYREKLAARRNPRDVEILDAVVALLAAD